MSVELKEITREEYLQTVKEMESKGYELGEKAKQKGWHFEGTNAYLYFYNRYADTLTPCLYRPRGIPGQKQLNPITGNNIVQKPVPKEYKVKRKANTILLHHLTLEGCPKIVPFKTRVQCAFSSGNKFFTCQHLVGDCPGKE